MSRQAKTKDTKNTQPPHTTAHQPETNTEAPVPWGWVVPTGTGITFAGSTTNAQKDLLYDHRLAPVQRQQLAARMGRLQGNQHLQQLVQVSPDLPFSASAQSQSPATVVQRDPPTGTVETSEGTEEIEGAEITSTGNIQDRLDLNHGSINSQIQSFVDESIGDVRDGLQTAASSFQLWYADRPRKPNTAEFVMDVAAGVISVISAAYPPAGIAAAVAGGLLSLAKNPIKDALDPNAAPDAQVRRLSQNVLRVGETMESRFRGFGEQLYRRNEQVWNNVGIALTMNPPAPQIAREELYQGAGLPQPDQPYAQQILSRMIYSFTDWEQRQELRGSRFFISAESVEYSLFTEQFRARLRRQAGEEATRRLGAQPEEQ